MMVGSTGKTYVSAVALQLVKEGKINLDDMASKYFTDSDKDWFSRLPNAETLTIRSLMNHTSGLPRYVFSRTFLTDIKQTPQKSHTPRECISVILDDKPKHAVGEGWGYSDTNYMVLGLIIEKVTGNSFYDEAQRRLLDPLKLTQTIPTTQAKLPGLMQGYIGKSNPFGLPKKTVANGTYALNPSFEWCGGGFMASVGDLAKWMQALHSGEVLDGKVYSQMIKPVDFRTGKPAKQGYGLGTFVWQTELGEFVGHAGMMPGYLTQIEFSRSHGFSVAYQINTDQGSSRSNHRHVVNFAKIVTENISNLP
jgi:D-alanyl-D-alanine carboxypeptidase